ncbi:uncharacterized protein J3D65DRAFT_630660 [Phyllosticta citribraziliensis]|uniref:Secreted protein n=1 Tax=Phyllosticta citribraziliensis TaxID=989973 RepID=A0ABR1LJA0_9PEZI
MAAYRFSIYITTSLFSFPFVVRISSLAGAGIFSAPDRLALVLVLRRPFLFHHFPIVSNIPNAAGYVGCGVFEEVLFVTVQISSIVRARR